MVGFQFLHNHQLCLQISSVLGFIPWLIFPFLDFPEGCFLSFTHHTALDSGNRDYTQQKAPISPYYRFSDLGYVWESKLNLFRFLNLLYYRGRGILLIRNPFLAILSMFRSWRVFFSPETEMRRERKIITLGCRFELQAPKVRPPLAVGVLAKKTQFTSWGKPKGELNSIAGSHNPRLKRKRNLLISKRYFTPKSFVTLRDGIFSAGEKSSKIGFVLSKIW